MINTIEHQIELLREGNHYKPHKHIALLAMLICMENNNFANNRLYFDDEFKHTFSIIFNLYSNVHDSNRPHNPYFHLRTVPFWELIPVSGKESELKTTSSIGGASQLLSLVSHVEINNDVILKLKDPIFLADIKKRITDILEIGRASCRERV